MAKHKQCADSEKYRKGEEGVMVLMSIKAIQIWINATHGPGNIYVQLNSHNME